MSIFTERAIQWSWNRTLTIDDSPILLMVHGTDEKKVWLGR